MEYVGKTVKKDFQGYGFFSGVVKSYDPSSGFFEVLYEDGDSEELEMSEVASLVEGKGMFVEPGNAETELVEKKPRLGRKPKRRRRAEPKQGEIHGESGNSGDNLVNDSVVVETLEKECWVGEDLKGNAFNSNDKLNLNLNDEVSLCDNSSDGLNLNVSAEENWERTKCIDLNLNVEGDFDENWNGANTVDADVKTLKKECSFDLNMGLDEENKDDCGGGNDAIQMVEETPKQEICGFVEETPTKGSVQNGNLNGISVGSVEGIEGNSVKGVSRVSDTSCVDDMSMAGIMVDHEHRGDTGSSYKRETSARKRRKLSDNSKEPVLRRSARRGSAAFSAPNHLSEATTSEVVNDPSSSPIISVASEEKPGISVGEISEELSVPKVKLQLPPSSQNLNVDGVPLLDLFSVYACLRSFSYLLFLSPFELEDFVAALKCGSPNSLVDFIHVSILQTLRKHLEFLSEEGSQSASNCLRCLDWGLLDLITWPLFVVEYLLIHGSALRPEFDLSCLKLFEGDYYKQPARVKVEILRCLCDDVIEVEAIRSELNRRSSAAEVAVGFDRNVNVGMCKKRRVAMDVPGGYSLSEDVVNETTDWNSDECCLCKMDGSLICCDGCPAAYHSRCVGVASDLLPEGEWYCPECLIDKDKPWMKPRTSLRGAELLGLDPHDRFYYSSCGYLLVLESCDMETVNYYHRNDLNDVIQVLKSSDIRFGGILNAISNHWGIPVHCREANSSFYPQNQGLCSDMNMKGQMPLLTLPPSGACEVKGDIVNDKKGEEIFIVLETPEAVNTDIQNCQKHGQDLLTGSAEILISNDSGIPGKCAVPGLLLSAINKRRESSQVDCSTTYMNYYCFAQPASSVAEELMHKSLDKFNVDSIKSVEEIISMQLMAISKKYSKFSWPNIPNINVHVQKENCGWCYSCKAPDDGRDCLLKMNDARPVQEGSESEVVDLLSRRNRRGHLVNIICHILCIEDRLRGLLLGPWLNPHYTKHWRKSVLKAPDVPSVKTPLLTLETNLRRLALSAEWLKHVDSVVTMGSASHVVASSVRVASKPGMGRKGAKHSGFDSVPSSKAASGLTLYWWRGGRISRPLFNWKVLPHFLARKAARQSGCTKIPGILYSDSSEFTKRSKNVAWRAAVEASTSPEQLAFLVRDLDSNIRWDVIENTHPLSKMDEFKKTTRPFKKVVIRRKSVEGTVVKYLLDFGKRKIIPDIVVKHGSMLEESSSGRKKFWLEELHVPLHLLKSFEEKRIARKGNKMSSGKLVDGSRVKSKPSRNKGFLYLFSRAERSENYQCGHCNKVVLIREAVSCQYCEGFFHKRHVRKSAGAITAECVYTCHRCQEGKHVHIDSKKRKAQAQFSKKASPKTRAIQSKNNKKACIDRRLVQSRNKKVLADVPLRRSARKLKFVALQKKKIGRPKKGKQVESKKGKQVKSKKGKQVKSKKGNQVKSKKETSEKPKKGTSWQKKRTAIYRSYWLRGLQLSKNPKDERVMHFRRKKLILPSEEFTVTHDSPKCSLCCEAGYTSTLDYISCEICGDWFHGDAFGLDSKNKGNLIGFRCHACRKRVPPFCPHLQLQSDGTQSEEAKGNGGVVSSVGVSYAVPPAHKVYVKRKSHSDEDSQRLCLIDESHHNEKHSLIVSNLNQSVGLESTVEVGGEHMATSKRQKTVATENSSDKVLKPDILMEFDENLRVNEITTISGEVPGTVKSLIEAEVVSCKSDVDVIDTELASCNNAKDDSQSLIDESHHNEKHSLIVPNLNQSVGLESTLEVGGEHMTICKRQKTVATENSSDKVLKPDILMEFDENLRVNEVTTISGEAHGTVKSLIEAEVVSCKSDVDVIDTELASCNNAKDGSVETTPILNSPGDNILANSSELHLQSIEATGG